MHSKTIETTTASVSLRPPGIMWIEYRVGARDTIAEAEENISAQEALGGGAAVPTLIDIRPMRAIEKDAREFYASERAEAVNKATALVVKSRISRVIGTFFIGLNRPRRPTKMFTSADDAVAWLEEFCE